MNRYSNYSVSGRDNVQKALFVNKKDLFISATTERDYSNFDIATLSLDNNLELIWDETYSSTGTRLSFERVMDMAVDSSGNVFVIGKSEMEYPIPFLMKLSSEGDLVWIFNFKESLDPYLEFGYCDIETDESGNCYIEASINSRGPNIFFKTMIFKFDPDGNILWYKGTDLPYPQRMILDNDQNIFIAYRNDESFKHKIVLQKYNTDGVLIFDTRSGETDVDVLDIKIDKDKSIYIFSNKKFYNNQSFLSNHVLISKYDSQGNVVSNLIIDNSSDTRKEVKFVQPASNSTFLIGINSYSTDNGIDNEIVRINTNLEILSSYYYDSEWHDNDYLISFDQINDNEIIVTGITYINAWDFYPFIYRLRDLSVMEWIVIPSISETTMAYPKNAFVDGTGSIILIGDAETTNTPQFGTTHSNIFVSKFSPAGDELLTKDFGAEGKSDISASKVKIDSKKELYVSGIVQNGPVYLHPKWNYNEDIFLSKYGADGAIKWNKVIGLPNGRVDYIDHFVTGDSIVTVVCYIAGQKTKLFNVTENGTIRDSIVFEGSLKEALPDSQRNLFLFLRSESEFRILKIKPDLSVDKNLLLPVTTVIIANAFLEDDLIYFVTGYPGDQQLYKYNTNLDKIWQVNMTTYCDFISLKTDRSGNLFVIGSKKVLKLSSNGILEWTKQLNYYNLKINLLGNGNLVLTGTTCGSSYCTPGYLILMSGYGEIIKTVSVPFAVRHLIIDNNDLVYLFGLENNYRKYSPNLSLLSNDSFREKSNGYSYFFSDVKISNDEIVVAGSNGAVWYPYNGLYSWHTLAVAKIGKVKSPPYFLDENIKIQMHPGDTRVLDIKAKDNDSDPFTLRLISHPDWIAFDESSGTMTIKTLSTFTLGDFMASVSISEINGGGDTVHVSVTLVNNAPFFTSEPISSVFAGSTYSYLLKASDQDNDEIFYEILTGPSWLNIGSTGLLSGTPNPTDIGTYEVILKCYDYHNGYSVQRFNLKVSPGTTAVTEADFSDEDEILLYPLPASRYLNVVCNKFHLQNAVLKILDSKGSIVKLFSNPGLMGDTNFQLDISDIPRGVYYLLIYDRNVQYSRKIVIQR